MGASLNTEEGIFHYYVFQKKLNIYFKGRIYKKDNTKIKEGYLLNPQYVSVWKKGIHYKTIEDFLDKSNITSYKINKVQKENIYNVIRNNIYQNNSFTRTSSFKSSNDFLQVSEKIISNKYLERIINKKINKSIINKSNKNSEPLYYILKQKMLILIFPYYYMIKIIISDRSPYSQEKKIVNLTFTFFYPNYYNQYVEIFRKESSSKLLDLFIVNGVFEQYQSRFFVQNKVVCSVYNEEQFIHEKKKMKFQPIIKAPQEINYSLIQRINTRGLENVGATCYMNATLQCLANIRPVTESLLKPKKYQIIYNNQDICKLTIEYCQVLIGLFCDNSPIGSYRPEQFKVTIGELNSLFQGVQANDSKDLIIFLLETLNKELVKLHNKTHNINEIENEFDLNIDPTNEAQVLGEFQKEFTKNYHSVVGFNLCGFQKNIFKCQSCQSISNSFGIFNFLIFGLEAVSNHFNLSNYNRQIPIINLDHCFKFMSKPESFDQTFCQKCRKTGMSVYQEGIYMMPNYLIIILNRGKGNVFNCKVDIPEKFNSSNYEQVKKNNNYELIGVVSHFGESGMGGHFIAFCKHYLDNKWRCYNDSTVVECKNHYLTKGTPYILFYKSSVSNNNYNNNIISQKNIINNPNPIFNNNFKQNNNMNFNNPQKKLQNMNMNMFPANNFQPMPQMNNIINQNLNLNNQGSHNNFNNNMNLNLINQGSQNNFNNNMNMINNQNLINNNMGIKKNNLRNSWNPQMNNFH